MWLPLNPPGGGSFIDPSAICFLFLIPGAGGTARAARKFGSVRTIPRRSFAPADDVQARPRRCGPDGSKGVAPFLAEAVSDQYIEWRS